MPFVANMSDNEEEKQGQPTQGAVSPNGGGGGAVRLAPSAAVAPTGGGASGGASGSGATPNSAGGSFGSLNNYLTANQGQAAPLAGKLTPSINQEYSNLDAQNNAAIANVTNQVKTAPGYTASNPDVLTQEAANPTAFSSDPNNVKQFQSLLQNTYSGPASAESTNEFSNQQNAINQSIAKGKAATQTEAGRENLLAQNEATPTTGVTALNSAILSQDPNALASVEGAYKPFNNLLTNLNTGAQGVNQTIGQEKADAANSSQAANEAINKQITGLNTNVANTLATTQKNATDANAKLKANLASGNLSAADLQTLGMSSDQWNSLTAAQKAAATSKPVYSSTGQFGANTGTANVDLSPYLTQNDPNAVFNTANVATPEQYQQAQAFQNLLKGLNTGAPATVLNPNEASQAGTAPKNLNAYDYKTALNAANNTTTDEQAAAQAYVNALQSGADETHAQLQANEAARFNKEKKAEASSMFGIPLAIASSLPGIGKPISKAVDTVVQFFCFHPDTLIEMANGNKLPISKVEVGAYTKGGLVLATSRAIGYDYHWYRGVLVTGKHAVKENGRWLRVEDSKVGIKLPGYIEVVCSLTTDQHRIWIDGIEFADERETDNYENLNLAQSLEALNNVHVE